MGVPTARRVRKRNEFHRVRESGRRASCNSFVVQCGDSGSADGFESRLGVIASRRVGNAVKRNRGKRLVRELFRIHGTPGLQGSDIVVVLRSNFDRYSFTELGLQYLKVCKRLSGQTPSR